jgi:SAM-dependent methyltransferase
LRFLSSEAWKPPRLIGSPTAFSRAGPYDQDDGSHSVELVSVASAFCSRGNVVECWRETMRITLFDEEYGAIDRKIATVPSCEVPRLFRNIPLDAFGYLLLGVPPQFPNLKAFFPSMAPDAVQDSWTGDHGISLLRRSAAFMRTLVSGYAAITEHAIEDATVLDYGCGWGRLIRLLYKYVAHEQIYAVDPSETAIELCREHGVKARLALSEYVPRSLPFARRFDLIYAFSVFTHLSEKTAHIVLSTLRDHIADTGVLVLTIRPKEYWHHRYSPGAMAAAMIETHDKTGFAFIPDNRLPIDGDITFGETSISLGYFVAHFPQWKLARVDYNLIDVYQVILFFQPA